MNKISRIFAHSGLMAAAIVFLFSCSESKENSENPTIELQSYSYDVISEFTNPDSTGIDGKYWRSVGSGVLPTNIGDRDIAFLRDSLCNLAKIEFSSENNAGPIISDDRKITNLSPDSVEARSYAIHNLDIVLTNPRIIVWRCYNSYYISMAAHSYYGTQYVNYDIAGNRILSLNDLLVKNYENELTGLLREKLAERDDLYTEMSEIGIPSQFRITNNGLRFVYSIYEIAPFSSGEVEVNLYYYEIADLLTPEGERIIMGRSILD